MRPRGVIQTLIRERQPFAVLAVLAALLPYVLSGAALTGPAGFRLTDGTLVICTNDGFVRVADQQGGAGHDLNDCCKAGCIHAFSKTAIGPAPVQEPVRFAAVVDFAWPIAADAAPGGPAGAGFLIRAPPATSV